MVAAFLEPAAQGRASDVYSDGRWSEPIQIHSKTDDRQVDGVDGDNEAPTRRTDCSRDNDPTTAEAATLAELCRLS